MKIVYVPLDERPCNYKFVQLMPLSGMDLTVPPVNLLGDKKRAAEFAPLKNWLLEAVKKADGLILSLDMLLFGGIVPSRLHDMTAEEISSRIDVIKEIRRINPSIKIYAFQLIMRCPWYSSSDEEPDYYENYGSQIHQMGRLRHLKMLGDLSDEDKKLEAEIEKTLDKSYLEDYLTRREKNTNSLLYSLSLCKSGLIDFFLVPQDDSAPHGFTALDQIKVREYIKENSLHLKALMYPGADEAGMSLLGKFISLQAKKQPKFYVHYSSSIGSKVIPSFEDRMIDETIKYQIMAVGGIRVYTLPEADILLAVNIGGEMSGITDSKNAIDYDVNRNLAEFVTYIKYAIDCKKAVAVADVAYANGGDIELIKLLESENLLYGINAYAGWNTSSNTLGTTTCQVLASVYTPDQNKNISFLTHRYIEDVCYCGYVRKMVVDQKLSALGYGYFNAGAKKGEVSGIVKEELLKYLKANIPAVYKKIDTLDISMPWARMFEIDVSAQIKN